MKPSHFNWPQILRLRHPAGASRQHFSATPLIEWNACLSILLSLMLVLPQVYAHEKQPFRQHSKTCGTAKAPLSVSTVCMPYEVSCEISSRFGLPCIHSKLGGDRMIEGCAFEVSTKGLIRAVLTFRTVTRESCRHGRPFHAILA